MVDARRSGSAERAVTEPAHCQRRVGCDGPAAAAQRSAFLSWTCGKRLPAGRCGRGVDESSGRLEAWRDGTTHWASGLRAAGCSFLVCLKFSDRSPAPGSVSWVSFPEGGSRPRSSSPSRGRVVVSGRGTPALPYYYCADCFCVGFMDCSVALHEFAEQGAAPVPS